MQSDIRLVLFLEKKTISVKIKLHQFSQNVSRNEGENFCHYFSFYDFASTTFTIFHQKTFLQIFICIFISEARVLQIIDQGMKKKINLWEFFL